ncbi:Glyoxylase, beta-lactamase superfamily II [Noviherbaspirillum humi]|uniref:Glyoxylase, beta-lactamase superfamily II n=1 Tax=Noviherbaspirillum humi TaxID=1688639 RepID=A0A239BU77_9BURK|nr:MBL fold metallo-hydrolase [Noviherbaspirillum humi]SNS10981.1 Glyoxylase, beta-lactamase superfamily II [Noviherbaspirillum humi]
MKLPPTMRVFERGWLSSNNIVFLGRNETAIVDTGYVSHANQTLALVRHALGGRRLDRIVNTHLHSDHCGGNAALQRAYASRTTIPADEAGKVLDWDEEALTYRATGQQCERFGFDDTYAPGDVLRLGDLDWRALASPGHDPHSLILHCEQEGILISADALWENGFGIIFPELEGQPGFADARATLDLIAGLEVRLVIPGHGAPFTDIGTALKKAYAVLDYFEADPARNATKAAKVLLKFLLLDKKRIPLGEVPAMLAGMPLLRETNRRFIGKEMGALSEWVVAQLVKAGAAAVEGDALVDA